MKGKLLSRNMRLPWTLKGRPGRNLQGRLFTAGEASAGYTDLHNSPAEWAKGISPSFVWHGE